jgi:hypothetical protein
MPGTPYFENFEDTCANQGLTVVTRSDAQQSRLPLTLNSVAPEPEGSSPRSQQPAIGPYPEPVEFTLHTPSQ